MRLFYDFFKKNYLFNQGLMRRSNFSTVGFQVVVNSSSFMDTVRNPKNLSDETAEIFVIFFKLSLQCS